MLWTRHAIPQARIVTLDTIRKLGAQPTFTTRELYEATHRFFPNVRMSKNLRPPLPGEPVPKNLKEKVKLRVQPIGDVPPPHPNHPIRSLKYLKDIVLEDFERRGFIKKVHTFRAPTKEELEQGSERVRNVSVTQRDEKGRPTGAPPDISKRVDVWRWHILPAGARMLGRPLGTDIQGVRQMKRKDILAAKAQRWEERMVGPRIAVWPVHDKHSLQLKTAPARTTS